MPRDRLIKACGTLLINSMLATAATNVPTTDAVRGCKSRYHCSAGPAMSVHVGSHTAEKGEIGSEVRVSTLTQRRKCAAAVGFFGNRPQHIGADSCTRMHPFHADAGTEAPPQGVQYCKVVTRLQRCSAMTPDRLFVFRSVCDIVEPCHGNC